MILGRLIRLLGAEEYALIRTKWMTKIFVTGDVLSFMAQGAGKCTSGATHSHNYVDHWIMALTTHSQAVASWQ
jgi:hypothetical protein